MRAGKGFNNAMQFKTQWLMACVKHVGKGLILMIVTSLHALKLYLKRP